MPETLQAATVGLWTEVYEVRKLKTVIEVWAILDLVHRARSGKAKHIDTQHLWIQQAVRNKTMTIAKTKGTENGADIFTKPLPAEKLSQLTNIRGCEYV